jgi:2-polyprenyl-3-methyl-5-hydroxy-6-metoxy-1,4-benzoquinol methylase
MAFHPPAAGTREFVERTRRAIENPPAGHDPWLLDYFGHLATPRGMNTYLRATEQMLELAGGVEGLDVLDAGSGFGTLSHLLASWGARRVYSVEVHDPMVRTHRLIREQYFPHLADVVRQVPGDVSTALLPSRSVDLVISIEAVSHYYDVPGFLDQCARVLRPGGRLFISDGNNGANPKIRRETTELWQRLEIGPHGPWMTHRIDETNVERRVRFIRERYPQIDEATRAALADATSITGPAELAAAVEAFLADGTMPDARYVRGTCPRDPHWGYWVEWLFDPRGLAMEIVNRGFDARAVPHYGGANNDAFLLVNRILRTIPSFRFARAFRIVATKH